MSHAVVGLAFGGPIGVPGALCYTYTVQFGLCKLCRIIIMQPYRTPALSPRSGPLLHLACELVALCDPEAKFLNEHAHPKVRKEPQLRADSLVVKIVGQRRELGALPVRCCVRQNCQRRAGPIQTELQLELSERNRWCRSGRVIGLDKAAQQLLLVLEQHARAARAESLGQADRKRRARRLSPIKKAAVNVAVREPPEVCVVRIGVGVLQRAVLLVLLREDVFRGARRVLSHRLHL
eukprot:2594524-Prymnesium_polylepis.1